MNYNIYTAKELEEELKDAERVYKQDKEQAIIAQKDLAKSGLAYCQVKMALLEREVGERTNVEKTSLNPKEMAEINLLDAMDGIELEIDLRLGVKGFIVKKGNKLALEIYSQVANGQDDTDWELADELPITIKVKK